MGVNEGHCAGDDPEGDKNAVLTTDRAAEKQLQRGEKQRPAEEGRPLRNEHIRDRVDPA